MKKNIQTTLIALLALLPLGMQAQSQRVDFSKYEGSQIANSDFEDWSGPDFENVPVGWHSFESVDGSSDLFIGFAKSTAHTEKETGHKAESYCLLLKPRTINVIFKKVLANGTITTGKMYAGATEADDPQNHAEMSLDDTGSSNGSPFYALLNSKPTALAVWLKFISNDSSNPYAKVSAVITDGTYYQDPEDKTYTNVYSKAQQSIASNGGDWQRVVIPFTVQNENVNPAAILVTISTNSTPGGGNANDKLYVDDLELIYTQEVVIPDCGYYAFTNIAQKNHAVVMPEGLVGYALGLTANGKPIVTKTYKAGDVIPYETSLLLEGKADDYYFKTTLYETGESPELNDDGKLVDGTELNDPIEGYQYYHLVSDVDGNPEFIVAEKGLKVMPVKALLRVKADLAAESYNHVLTESSVEGDVDGNGKVEATDVKALVDRLLGNELGMKGFLIPDADVNGDKTVDVADVTQLINILLHE